MVVTARHAALAPWWHTYATGDRDHARGLSTRSVRAACMTMRFGTLSTGEQRRVQIARALMPDPDLLILDEPGASLDLGARETLVRDLGRLAAGRRHAASCS